MQGNQTQTFAPPSQSGAVSLGDLRGISARRDGVAFAVYRRADTVALRSGGRRESGGEALSARGRRRRLALRRFAPGIQNGIARAPAAGAGPGPERLPRAPRYLSSEKRARWPGVYRVRRDQGSASR